MGELAEQGTSPRDARTTGGGVSTLLSVSLILYETCTKSKIKTHMTGLNRSAPRWGGPTPVQLDLTLS